MSVPLHSLVPQGELVPGVGSRYLFGELKVRVPPEFKTEKEWVNWLNATRDWLKHETPQLGDEWEIDPYSAAIMILRAVTKFEWTYRQSSQRMRGFVERWRNGEYDGCDTKH